LNQRGIENINCDKVERAGQVEDLIEKLRWEGNLGRRIIFSSRKKKIGIGLVIIKRKKAKVRKGKISLNSQVGEEGAQTGVHSS